MEKDILEGSIIGLAEKNNLVMVDGSKMKPRSCWGDPDSKEIMRGRTTLLIDGLVQRSISFTLVFE